MLQGSGGWLADSTGHQQVTGHWTLDTGHWTLDYTVDSGHFTLDTGHWTTHWTLDTLHWTLDRIKTPGEKAAVRRPQRLGTFLVTWDTLQSTL